MIEDDNIYDFFLFLNKPPRAIWPPVLCPLSALRRNRRMVSALALFVVHQKYPIWCKICYALSPLRKRRHQTIHRRRHPLQSLPHEIDPSGR